jgi:hypothetical protein
MKVNSYIIAPTIGFPSINVSIGFDSDNLPYGMEILSKPNEENLLYNLAYYYQEKTNYYKLPDIAPSLYEMPEGIELLISNYEKLTSKKYSSVKKEVYEFFTNYNDVENKEETITKLNNEYSKLKKQIIPTSINVDESLINKLIKFGTKLLLSFILLFTIIFVILKKVERKNKSLKFNIKKFFKLLFKMIIIYIFIFIIYLYLLYIFYIFISSKILIFLFLFFYVILLMNLILRGELYGIKYNCII